ncbi:17606_t:CDS:2, partial [Gigaspora rosea]
MSLVADYSSDISSSDEEITSTADGPVKIVVDLPQIKLEEEEN